MFEFVQKLQGMVRCIEYFVDINVIIIHCLLQPAVGVSVVVLTVLLCRLSEMVSMHRVHTHERDDMCSRAEMTTESITEHTSRTSTLEELYQFFQETRGYVRDLVECLNEKVGSR